VSGKTKAGKTQAAEFKAADPVKLPRPGKASGTPPTGALSAGGFAKPAPQGKATAPSGTEPPRVAGVAKPAPQGKATAPTGTSASAQAGSQGGSAPQLAPPGKTSASPKVGHRELAAPTPSAVSERGDPAAVKASIERVRAELQKRYPYLAEVLPSSAVQNWGRGLQAARNNVRVADEKKSFERAFRRDHPDAGPLISDHPDYITGYERIARQMMTVRPTDARVQIRPLDVLDPAIVAAAARDIDPQFVLTNAYAESQFARMIVSELTQARLDVRLNNLALPALADLNDRLDVNYILPTGEAIHPERGLITLQSLLQVRRFNELYTELVLGSHACHATRNAYESLREAAHRTGSRQQVVAELRDSYLVNLVRTDSFDSSLGYWLPTPSEQRLIERNLEEIRVAVAGHDLPTAWLKMSDLVPLIDRAAHSVDPAKASIDEGLAATVTWLRGLEETCVMALGIAASLEGIPPVDKALLMGAYATDIVSANAAGEALSGGSVDTQKLGKDMMRAFAAAAVQDLAKTKLTEALKKELSGAFAHYFGKARPEYLKLLVNAAASNVSASYIGMMKALPQIAAGEQSWTELGKETLKGVIKTTAKEMVKFYFKAR
jgi:hypothetical protein